MTNLYTYKAKTRQGEILDFASLQGKVLLIVNIATKCGFTPQLRGLEDLYQHYRDRGLLVLGFPCNQFAKQAPLGAEETAQFCALNYGVSFPIMAQVRVNGQDADPLFKYLKAKAPGLFCNAIKWNFTKFLISADGKLAKRYAPVASPAKLIPEIERMLVAL